MRKRLIAISLLTWCYLPACTTWIGVYKIGTRRSHAAQAAELREEENFEQAINEYLLHIDDLLQDPHRPAEENVFFYYLLIGDLYLKLDDFENARRAYELSAEKDVRPAALVTDRFRQLGKYWEEKGEYERAIEVLTPYRDRDPLLINSDLDRFHKEFIRAEDAVE